MVLYSIFLSIITFVNNPLTTNLRVKFQEINLFLKFILGVFLIFMFFYLLNRAYKKSKFIFEMNQFTSNLEKERVNQTMGLLIKNYKSITPSTAIVSEILDEFRKRAKKWSSDSYLAGHELEIWVKKDQISMEMNVNFFSKKKRAEVKFRTVGMKIPQQLSIAPNQIIQYESMLEMKPIFLEKKWRELVVEALERIESEIAGHEFYMTIGVEVGGIIRFYLDPGFVPHKSFTFHFKNGTMYKDLLCYNKVVTLK